MKKKGIIFDLDGTLWEVTDMTYRSANEITKKYNLSEVKIETILDVFGLNREESAKLYFPHIPLQQALELIDEIVILNISNLKKHGGNVYDGLEKTLLKLKDSYELFIVSNTSHKEYIEAFLNSSNLGMYFKDYLAASELHISKAEAIRKVIKQYDLVDYVYVGDTKKDLEATQMAHVQFIQAKYGFGEDLKTEYSIQSITELPEIVSKVVG